MRLMLLVVPLSDNRTSSEATPTHVAFLHYEALQEFPLAAPEQKKGGSPQALLEWPTKLCSEGALADLHARVKQSQRHFFTAFCSRC